jgi:hypothetical protein
MSETDAEKVSQGDLGGSTMKTGHLSAFRREQTISSIAP